MLLNTSKCSILFTMWSKKNLHKMSSYISSIIYSQISGVVKSMPGNKPGEIICRVAEEECASMVVIGTRGLGKVSNNIN